MQSLGSLVVAGTIQGLIDTTAGATTFISEAEIDRGVGAISLSDQQWVRHCESTAAMFQSEAGSNSSGYPQLLRNSFSARVRSLEKQHDMAGTHAGDRKYRGQRSLLF